MKNNFLAHLKPQDWVYWELYRKTLTKGLWIFHITQRMPLQGIIIIDKMRSAYVQDAILQLTIKIDIAIEDKRPLLFEALNLESKFIY